MKDAPYGKGAHVLRKADHKPRKKAAPLPAREYPAGFFTELVVQHDWPPSFMSAMPPDTTLFARRAEYARRASEQKDAGIGHAAMPLNLPGALPHASRPLNFGSIKRAVS